MLISLARRLPYSSRILRQLEPAFEEKVARLTSQRDTLKLKLSDARAKLAAARAQTIEMKTKWLDRSKATYDADGLIVLKRPVPFLDDPAFEEAYQFGANSGHRFFGPGGRPEDLHIEWRAAVCLWAGWHAKQLPGDFVECGVNTGIFSRAICRYVDFNSTGKNFYLFDTYAGIPPEHAEVGREDYVTYTNNKFYFDAWDLIQKNFAEFPNARPIRGRVPDTLQTVTIEEVAYLSIDMNVTAPEVAALEYFWPKLVKGGVVIFDDYGFHSEQRIALDALVAQWGVKIWLLPTGQGLLLKT